MLLSRPAYRQLRLSASHKHSTRSAPCLMLEPMAHSQNVDPPDALGSWLALDTGTGTVGILLILSGKCSSRDLN